MYIIFCISIKCNISIASLNIYNVLLNITHFINIRVKITQYWQVLVSHEQNSPAEGTSWQIITCMKTYTWLQLLHTGFIKADTQTVQWYSKNMSSKQKSNNISNTSSTLCCILCVSSYVMLKISVYDHELLNNSSIYYLLFHIYLYKDKIICNS